MGKRHGHMQTLKHILTVLLSLFSNISTRKKGVEKLLLSEILNSYYKNEASLNESD